jgi:hypothetical protein
MDDTIDTKKMSPLLQEKQRDADGILKGERGRRSRGVLDIDHVEDVAGWV